MNSQHKATYYFNGSCNSASNKNNNNRVIIMPDIPDLKVGNPHYFAYHSNDDFGVIHKEAEEPTLENCVCSIRIPISSGP